MKDMTKDEALEELLAGLSPMMRMHLLTDMKECLSKRVGNLRRDIDGPYRARNSPTAESMHEWCEAGEALLRACRRAGR